MTAVAALFPSVPAVGPDRAERWSELCDEIFRFGMRPEVAAIAEDSLRICVAANSAIHRWQRAVDSGAHPVEVEQLAVAAELAYSRVEVLRDALREAG